MNEGESKFRVSLGTDKIDYDEPIRGYGHSHVFFGNETWWFKLKAWVRRNLGLEPSYTKLREGLYDLSGGSVVYYGHQDWTRGWDRIFPVWSEGYAINGNRSGAQFHGYFSGETFEEACQSWVNSLPESERDYYHAPTNRYWGCRLFDNEADARRSFG